VALHARPFFLQTGNGADQRLCIFHPAATAEPRGRVVYVHPFAEEMNKSRRMAALQARALAQAGFAVLQIDLLGCGDSSGDFGDASWDAWVDDVVRAVQWLDAQQIGGPLWLWGLRAGCLLAVAAAARLEGDVNFCFWQPAAKGQLLLQQFLRLKVAAGMADGGNKGLMEQMRGELARGGSVEVAGYLLGAGLANGLEGATLAPPTRRPARVEWLELASRPDAELTPAARQAQERWQEAGWQLHSRIVQGPAFWQTTEIEEVPALVEATLEALA